MVRIAHGKNSRYKYLWRMIMRNTMAMVAVSVLVSLMLMGQGCPTPAPDLVVDLGDDQTIDLGWAAFIP